jgi:hypothetical protein
VPLAEVLDPSRLQWESRTMRGMAIDYPHFDLAGHAVWGATAMMLGVFACLFDPVFEPPRKPQMPSRPDRQDTGALD